jgi:two-component system, chemotaxis family, chemotaxis protein CheY
MEPVMLVLVVDDNATVRQITRRMLETAAFAVIEAANGIEALRLYRSERPDLVVCDIFMPEQDGLELIRHLREEFPDVKILAMSGGGFKGKMNLLPSARQLGATDVLAKPFPKSELLAAVDAILYPKTATARN